MLGVARGCRVFSSVIEIKKFASMWGSNQGVNHLCENMAVQDELGSQIGSFRAFEKYAKSINTQDIKTLDDKPATMAV